MENVLFNEIVKLVLIFISPLIILSLLFFNVKPAIALAFLIGAFLGILRLKALFSYITCILNREGKGKDTISLIKYLVSLIFTLAAIGFVLLKSVKMGLAILSGLIAIPIIVTIYSTVNGISLYRKR